MRRLICAFVVCKWQNRLWCGSNFNLRCSQQVGYCSVNARVRNVATLDLVRDVIIAAESFYAARTLREERYNGVVLQKLSVCQFNILLLEESICCGNGLKDVQSTKGIFYEGITFRKKRYLDFAVLIHWRVEVLHVDRTCMCTWTTAEPRVRLLQRNRFKPPTPE